MRLLEIQEKLTFSGVGADSKRLSLPKVYARAMAVSAVINVTDTGISAGENLDGCVNFMRVGDQSNPILYAERDELALLCSIAAPDGYDTGTTLVDDGTPTSATDEAIKYLFYGPFDFRKCKNPGFQLALRAITEEFGGATAFTATVTVTLLVEDVPAGAASYKYVREYRASAARHEITPTAGYISGLFTKISTQSYYKRITAQAENGDLAIDVSDPYAAQIIYQSKAAVAVASAAGYAYVPCEYPDGTNRKIIVELGTASVMTAFVRSLA